MKLQFICWMIVLCCMAFACGWGFRHMLHFAQRVDWDSNSTAFFICTAIAVTGVSGLALADYLLTKSP